MKESPEELLEICLEMERRGEDWKAYLSAYPDRSGEVAGLVTLAREVREASAAAEAPAPGLSAALLRMGWAAAREEAKRDEASRERRSGWWRSAWVRAAVAGVAMLVLGASSVELSARTVPGDFLYPVKILTERVHFALTSNPEDRVELRLTFSERRLSEVVKTLKEGKGADRALISRMLDEAKAALADADQLPASQASAYKAQIASLERVQKDRLSAVESTVPADRRPAVAEAIGMCDAGWAGMREMMRGMPMGGGGRGMGGMMMGPAGNGRGR
jgi:Domain of unknown function (DUF5667)